MTHEILQVLLHYRKKHGYCVMAILLSSICAMREMDFNNAGLSNTFTG